MKFKWKIVDSTFILGLSFLSLHFLFYTLVTASSHPDYAVACQLIFLVPFLAIYSFLQYSQNYLKHGSQIISMPYLRSSLMASYHT